MEWLNGMRTAIDYIEDNLTNDIDLNEVAKRTFCSTFHFQRLFSVLMGVSVGEYIRRRRLTLAAQELLSENKRIIDVALKYGYESPDAFTQAFQKMHGLSPSAARESGVQLVAYPRISFQIILKGGIDMDYKIVEEDAFEVVGKAKKFLNTDDSTVKVPEFWGECKKSGLFGKLCKVEVGSITRGETLGICVGDKEGFTYVIGAEKGDAKISDDFDVVTIPASTWAVFKSIGPMPGAIQAVWKKIYEEWFPSTGYEQAGTPDLEVYMPGDVDSENYYSEIWVPIKKTKK